MIEAISVRQPSGASTRGRRAEISGRPRFPAATAGAPYLSNGARSLARSAVPSPSAGKQGRPAIRTLPETQPRVRRRRSIGEPIRQHRPPRPCVVKRRSHRRRGCCDSVLKLCLIGDVQMQLVTPALGGSDPPLPLTRSWIFLGVCGLNLELESLDS